MSDISEFIKNMQKLIDSQKLLDDILQHYDVYSDKFDNDRIAQMDDYTDYKDKLKTRIRNYIKFDGSE